MKNFMCLTGIFIGLSCALILATYAILETLLMIYNIIF